MNTYIQDKLDEFDKRFVYPLNFDFKVKENEPFLDDSSMADGYGSAADYLKEFLEQSLTDYHNHIVEKIKNSDKAFGIIDKDGKGGAILITDIEKII